MEDFNKIQQALEVINAYVGDQEKVAHLNSQLETITGEELHLYKFEFRDCEVDEDGFVFARNEEDAIKKSDWDHSKDQLKVELVMTNEQLLTLFNYFKVTTFYEDMD